MRIQLPYLKGGNELDRKTLPASDWHAIWECQRIQQERLGLCPSKLDSSAKRTLFKDLIMGLYEEVGELASVTADHKVHILRSGPKEGRQTVQEVADVLKYTIAIAQLLGVDSDDVILEFVRKSAEVEAKAKSESIQLGRDVSVVVLDVDGVLADASLLDREVMSVERPTKAETLKAREFMKKEHRQAGRYAELPLIPGAVEGVNRLKDAGCKIVIITSRPYHQHKRLYGDTQHWLEEHGIPFDLLIFNRDKAEAIAEHVFPARPWFCVEDRLKHAMELAELGIPVVLLGETCDDGITDIPLVTRVASWMEIAEWKTPKRR